MMASFALATELGLPTPEATENTFVVEADQVIAAIGQALDTKEILGDVDVKMGMNKFIASDPLTGQTSVPWVFSGGDASAGPSSVAEAVGAGERAAVGIDMYLSGECHAFWREDQQVVTDYDPDDDPVEYGRAQMKLIPVGRRIHNFNEVELPFADKVAVREAKRCLRCDYRANCK